MRFADQNDNSKVGVPSLLDGNYDEGQSHQGFLEALNAWRNVGKDEKPKETPTKSNGKVVNEKDVEKAWK